MASPPLQPCMGQHLHFERNLEKLKEPTNILETFEKKKKKIRVLEIFDGHGKLKMTVEAYLELKIKLCRS